MLFELMAFRSQSIILANIYNMSVECCLIKMHHPMVPQPVVVGTCATCAPMHNNCLLVPNGRTSWIRGITSLAGYLT